MGHATMTRLSGGSRSRIALCRIRTIQSLNRYSYVLNNPLRYTDPTGHAYCDDHVCQGDDDSTETPGSAGGIYSGENDETRGDSGPGGGNDAITGRAGVIAGKEQCELAICIRAPSREKDGYTGVVRQIQHTLTWSQLGFECTGKYCVPAINFEHGNFVVDAYITVETGTRAGGTVVKIQFDPAKQTLKEMQLSVVFALQDLKDFAL